MPVVKIALVTIFVFSLYNICISLYLYFVVFVLCFHICIFFRQYCVCDQTLISSLHYLKLIVEFAQHLYLYLFWPSYLESPLSQGNCGGGAGICPTEAAGGQLMI